VPVYLSLEGSHGWASFPMSCPIDVPLDDLGPDDFSLEFSTVGPYPR
jgi:hypothetical protein